MNIDGQTQVYGILGYPVSHTASPAMHSAGYTLHGLNAVYLPFEVAPDQLGAAAKGLRALHILGVNITIPHKETIVSLLDEVESQAQKIGAVNTVINRNGHLIGYNTDGRGFLWGIQQEVSPSWECSRATILGAGGSARSIAVALLEQGTHHLTIGYRTPGPAQILATHLAHHFPQAQIITQDFHSLQQSEALRLPQLVVQTTPLGMSPHQDACVFEQFDWVSDQHLCVDIIYKPEITLFLEKARIKGAKILGGAAMLAGQGCIAFELMTGKSVSYRCFRDQI